MEDITFEEAGTMKRNMKYWKTTNSKTTTAQQKIGLKRNNNKTLDLNWLNIIYHRLILLLLRQLSIVKWCFLWELSALLNTIFFSSWWITDGQIRVENFEYLHLDLLSLGHIFQRIPHLTIVRKWWNTKYDNLFLSVQLYNAIPCVPSKHSI